MIVKLLTILSFHGSPGSPADFSLLETKIKANWIHQNRNIQKENTQLNNTNKDQVLMGYSWGCRELFRYYEKLKNNKQQKKNYQKIKAIVLISPFIFTEKSSFLSRMIFQIPILSKLIVHFIGEKLISKFLVKSSFPDAVSEIYFDQLKKLSNFRLLKQSVFEKDHFLLEDFKKINNSIPVLLLWATDDQTSLENVQIQPILKHFKTVTFIEIKAAGHALPWLRSKEIAPIIYKFLEKLDEKNEKIKEEIKEEL